MTPRQCKVDMSSTCEFEVLVPGCERGEKGNARCKTAAQLRHYCHLPGYRTADLSDLLVVQSQFVTIKFGAF